MKSCVLVVAAKAAGAGDQVVTGVVDETGTNFTGKLAFIFGNSTVNTLETYYRRSCGIDDASTFKKSLAQEEILHPAGVKSVSYSQSGAYSILDHLGSIFFGGFTERTAYISAFASGQFTITYDSNIRTGDSFIVVVLGGSDLTYAITNLFTTTITAGFSPAGILFEGLPSETLTNTSTGGGADSLGWATRSDVGQGSSASVVGSQGKNGRYQRSSLCYTALNYDIISDMVSIVRAITLATWTATGATTTGTGASTIRAVALGGTGIQARSGSFTPSATGAMSLTTGLKNRLVLFSSVGKAADTTLTTDLAMLCYGMMSESAQAALYSGEAKGTDGPPLQGARYLSNADVMLCGDPNAGSTTFSTRIQFTTFNHIDGLVNLNVSALGAVHPEILWFAIGEAVDPAPTRLILSLDNAAGVGDAGEVYQAYVKTRAIPPTGKLTKMGLTREALLVAHPQANTQIQLTVHRDFDVQVQTSQVDLTPASIETHVVRKFQDAGQADMDVVQFTIGDPSARDSKWALDQLQVREIDEGEK